MCLPRVSGSNDCDLKPGVFLEDGENQLTEAKSSLKDDHTATGATLTHTWSDRVFWPV